LRKQKHHYDQWLEERQREVRSELLAFGFGIQKEQHTPTKQHSAPNSTDVSPNMSARQQRRAKLHPQAATTSAADRSKQDDGSLPARLALANEIMSSLLPDMPSLSPETRDAIQLFLQDLQNRLSASTAVKQ
jgi:hypothetical protein